MYSNPIVKIEACDEVLEDEPEVDPFMDISSLGSAKVKVEAFEGVISNSEDIDQKPEFPDLKNVLNPEEFLQIKMETPEEITHPTPICSNSSTNSTSELEVKPEVFPEKDEKPSIKMESSIVEEKWPDGSLPINPSTIKEIKPMTKGLTRVLMGDWRGDKCLRFIPNKNGPYGIRCEVCFRDFTIIGLSKKVKSGCASKEGLSFNNLNITSNLQQHLNGTRHLQCLKTKNRSSKATQHHSSR